MNVVRTERELIARIKSFEPGIIVPWSNGETLFRKTTENNPKLLYLIDECRVSERFDPTLRCPVTELTIKYNKDGLSYDDVFAVGDASDVMARLFDCVGNFKPKIGLVSRDYIDIGVLINLFGNRYSAMYPHAVSLSATTVKSNKLCRYTISITYRITRDKMVVMGNAVERESQRVASLLFEPSMPDAVKIYLAHNYLSTSIEYYGADSVNPLEKSFVHSAYGAFVTKKCVCQGVANAFKILMDKADVDCEVVCGQIVGSSGYHAWNIVRKEDGCCFHVDATWDISSGYPVFTYFGKNDSFFKDTRVWNKDNYPKCHSRQNLYMLARQYIVENADRLIAKKIPPEVIGL